jgi:SAM-dependent methyltransferase
MIKVTLKSEEASEHWPWFNTTNHTVLDLGCGRWGLEKEDELSPIYFAKTANRVIGIDGYEVDILFYQNKTKNDLKYTFKHMTITSVEQVRELLNKYSITALKSDIEGGEIVLLDLTKEDLSKVTELAVEFHSIKLKQAFIEKIKDLGFILKADAKFVCAPGGNIGVLFCYKPQLLR